MPLWFWKRRERSTNPLQAYDEALELLERRGAELRRAAATLLTLRADLHRQGERQSAQLRDLQGRESVARTRQDETAVRALERDQTQIRRLLQSVEAGLARSEADGALLTEAASEVGERLVALGAERTAAAARLAAGEAQIQAGRLAMDLEWSSALKLDEARDDVERAHALAEVYRESRRVKG